MKLQLSHLKAGADEDARSFVVPYEPGSALRRFERFARVLECRHVNWPLSFSRRGLPHDAYRCAQQTPEEDEIVHRFVRASEADFADLPEEVIFRVPRALGAAPATGVAATASRHGVLYAERVASRYTALKTSARGPCLAGDAFEVLTTRAEIEALQAQCVDEDARHLQAEFLDRWDDERSFVIVRH